MATWTTGVPYTDASADQVTTEVNGDRSATLSADTGTDIDTILATTGSLDSIGLGNRVRDAGALVSNTASPTSLLATPAAMKIPGGTAAAGDLFIYEQSGSGANASGTSRTITTTPTFGGSNIFTTAPVVTVANGVFSKFWKLRIVIDFDSVGSSGVAQVDATMFWGTDSLETVAASFVTTGPISSLNTNNDLTLAVTTTLSGLANAALGNQGRHAVFYKLRKGT